MFIQAYPSVSLLYPCLHRFIKQISEEGLILLQLNSEQACVQSTRYLVYFYSDMLDEFSYQIMCPTKFIEVMPISPFFSYDMFVVAQTSVTAACLSFLFTGS
jgi:hypothetical protein